MSRQNVRLSRGFGPSLARCVLVIGTAAATPFFSHRLLAEQLNDTGVQSCFDATGSAVPCNSTHARDDGRFGRDAAATTGHLRKVGAGPAGFDFIKIANDGAELPFSATLGNGAGDWACTKDNATGLTWEVKTGGDQDVRSRRQHFTWYNPNGTENGGNAGSPRITHYSSCNGTLAECNTQKYVEKINDLALCGFRDWRLPTPGELRGIVNYSLGLAGHFNADYFTLPDPQWPSPHYWTSATYADDPADAWLVEIGGEADGGGAGHHHPKNEERLILLVRGGTQTSSGDCSAGIPRANVRPTTPTVEFVDHGDGTLTHLTTGLMWKRCAEGRSGDACSIGPNDPALDAENFSFSQALERAETSVFAGYSDWRVPNLKELYSVVEHCGHSMAMNQSVFPNIPFRAGGAVYWTSTADPRTSANAFLVFFQHGGAVPVSKESRLYLRLVRGGDKYSGFDARNPNIPPERRRAVRRRP
jgi:hypothetical protein